MISGTQIHHWLQEPDLLLQEDELKLKELEKKYPYFSLAHLFSHYQRLGNVTNRDLLEIYGYNPVVYYYWKEKEQWGLQSFAMPDTDSEELQPEQVVVSGQILDIEEEFVFDAPSVDYFSQQGIKVSAELPEKDPLDIEESVAAGAEEDGDKSLLVVMSFAEWLQFLQNKTHHEQQEEEEKRALKALWQKQKMAEAIEEENDEIPASVFEMAVNSISREEAVVSESMAIVYAKQGKIRESIEMYQKLSLKNPDKSVYFALKIENLQKELK